MKKEPAASRNYGSGVGSKNWFEVSSAISSSLVLETPNPENKL